MSKIKRDDNMEKWEDSEFPLVCETCLGDNPYVRMTKEKFGKKCQICETPFTVFAWQAGTKGRLKRVEICKSCAQAKNVCQVCIYDLQYGLPVGVRDKVLREAGSAGATSAVPQSNANRAWHKAQQEQAIAQGKDLVGEANALAVAKLKEMANMKPRYERNLPNLCSFFARGECNRGASCPFRHEMPRDRNDPMSKQTTKNRFYGNDDPVASKVMGRQSQRDAKQNQSDRDGLGKAKATLYLKLQGDQPYPNLTEDDVRDKFYSFGEIVSVRLQADKGQAFVEYTQSEAAELAISSMNRQELVGRKMYVSWARAPKRGDEGSGYRGARVIRDESSSSSETPALRPLLPPGGAGNAKIPKGLVAARPPPEVAAIAAARRQNRGGASSSFTSGVPRPSSSVPRPGGGPIRRAGANAARKVGGPRAPYYPSADPSRLGSKPVA
mmetsp:Transcript_8514/g.24513  ORF Transcript_8514/g.24513 Transcript_8514/m.24513 type:complete len:440 (-) Transcript_8514:146-1465(-)|eukprot:CAMPEP_0119551088 /NCGR_PEP_ID=MMETSP1352-20130426/4455_1 /TAXON_ID=265584 /ORGANISM="Stauroneis constricta, Strain CCMP1120" /LENGTH=439 /DNA_ID=CAMNT_0007597097 /DNA_START=67 /DNA_END=1386 /DNA_ORIENTATION=+